MFRPIALTAALLVLAPGAAIQAQEEETPPRPEPLTATADLKSPDGRTVGKARLSEAASGGVLLILEVEGLEPGAHGLHIHETGRCETPDFTSAGGHFSPRGNSHGFLTSWGEHAGDLLNLHVSHDGTATTERLARGATLHEGPSHSLLDWDGSAIVIHAGADDYESQPSGAAGSRVACGVVHARHDGDG